MIKPKIYIISDTHFDHNNIIKYQNRPFRDVTDMNKTMINNWNSTVNQYDTVYFLGDLCLGNPGYWLQNLNGNKIMIRGNHDHLLKGAHRYLFLEYNNETVLLVHSPDFIDFKWDGWTLHGHHHSNEPIKFPLINNQQKTMNVCVEMIGYKPMELSALMKMRSLL